MAVTESALSKPMPFDAKQLDKLLDDAGIDVLVATSKHNIQYLLGGYRFFFFDTMDAVGVSRYLPALVYQKGKPENTAYVGCAMENYEKELGKFWPPASGSWRHRQPRPRPNARSATSRSSAACAASASSSGFLPADAEGVLRQGLSNVEVVDAVFPLERLRARKTPQEIEWLREASERVIDSMLTVFACCPTRHDQARAGRDAAPRGGQPRPRVRLLPDHRRHQPQPRALRAAPRARRYHVARLRRQLQGLHRRPLPHGHPRQARRRAGRPPRLDRRRAAGRPQAGQARRPRRRRHLHRRGHARRPPRTRPTRTSWRTAWASSRTRRRAS